LASAALGIFVTAFFVLVAYTRQKSWFCIVGTLSARMSGLGINAENAETHFEFVKMSLGPLRNYFWSYSLHNSSALARDCEI
jgi:hypothetical protein